MRKLTEHASDAVSEERTDDDVDAIDIVAVSPWRRRTPTA
jgi:hypothetical protein